MTIEEFEKIPFHFMSHMSMVDEHTIVYATQDNKFMYCVHQPYKDGQPCGRRYCHYRIGTKIYKSKKKFLEAIEKL